MFRKKITRSQKIKTKARRTLSGSFTAKFKTNKNYVVDTSVVIKKFLPKLIFRGLKGKIIIPNAVMAELENLANKGSEAGFEGLDEIAKLHKLVKKNKDISIFFEGIRPQDMHIKYAKSGEIDAIIRQIALNNKAVLITADLVQAKSAQAYGLEVLFLKPKIEKKKKGFWFWKR